MFLNEQGFWRLAIAGAIGLGAAGVALVVDTLFRHPKLPIAAGVSAAVTAYAIDLYTEHKTG